MFENLPSDWYMSVNRDLFSEEQEFKLPEVFAFMYLRLRFDLEEFFVGCRQI